MNIFFIVLYMITLGLAVDMRLGDDLLILFGFMSVAFIMQFVFLSVGIISLRTEKFGDIRFWNLLNKKPKEFSKSMIKKARVVTRIAHESIIASGFICWIMTVYFLSNFIPNSTKIVQMFHFPILWIFLPLVLMFFIDSFVLRRTAWLYPDNSLHNKVGNPWKNWLKFHVVITLFLTMNYEIPSVTSELWIILASSFPLSAVICYSIYYAQSHLTKRGRA